MAEMEIGVVTHYFNHLSVAAIQITNGELAVGDTVHVKGHTSDFNTKVESMQVNHASVTKARTGENVGMKVPAHAHEHDKVYKVVPDA